MAAASKSSRVARLLLKAVRSLPEKEQQVVLEYLVEAGLTAPGGRALTAQRREQEATKQISPEAMTSANPQRHEHVLRVHGALGPEGTVSPPPGPHHQMVPVRLSEPQHRLLKEWCSEHNFPMAVVIRGLVERFLEGQGRRAS